MGPGERATGGMGRLGAELGEMRNFIINGERIIGYLLGRENDNQLN